MTDEQFITWLKGFLENAGNEGLNRSRLNAIKNKLSQIKDSKNKNTMIENNKGTGLILSC